MGDMTNLYLAPTLTSNVITIKSLHSPKQLSTLSLLYFKYSATRHLLKTISDAFLKIHKCCIQQLLSFCCKYGSLYMEMNAFNSVMTFLI